MLRSFPRAVGFNRRVHESAHCQVGALVQELGLGQLSMTTQLLSALRSELLPSPLKEKERYRDRQRETERRTERERDLLLCRKLTYHV